MTSSVAEQGEVKRAVVVHATIGLVANSHAINRALLRAAISNPGIRNRRETMTDDRRMQWLKIFLYAFGVIFVVGVYLMMMWVWPSGWGWEPRQPEYEQMIIGVYATLGIFLIRAAKDPMANLSLIWFTIWSSIVHGGIMAVQAIVDVTERANLLGDIPALFLVALVLWYLLPRGDAPQAAS